MSTIGAGWLDMGKQGEIPKDEQRTAYAAKMREGLPPLRHKVSMRYERLFGTWRVTFSDAGGVLYECQISMTTPWRKRFGGAGASPALRIVRRWS